MPESPSVYSVQVLLSKVIKDIGVVRRPARSLKHSPVDVLEKGCEELRVETDEELIEVRRLLVRAKMRLEEANHGTKES